MRTDFPKSARLIKRRQFEALSRTGKRLRGDWITLEARPLREGLRPKLGVTVTRKFGKAHDRNRFKRLTREAFRHCQDKLPLLEINVRPKTNHLIPSLPQIIEDLLKLVGSGPS